VPIACARMPRSLFEARALGGNTGEVVVRSIKVGGHTEYIRSGRTNLAARMRPRPGGFDRGREATAATVRQGYFGVGPLATGDKRCSRPGRRVRGVCGRGVYGRIPALGAARAGRGSSGASASGGDGRRVEPGQEGHGQIGAQLARGAGKSRLLYEFQGHYPDGCQVWSDSSRTARRQLDDGDIDLLKSYSIDREDDDVAGSAKVRQNAWSPTEFAETPDIRAASVSAGAGAPLAMMERG